MSSRLHVAVGVILDAQQRVLIALRPQHVHQGGLWEFPGGKVETGETVQHALQRELDEELGIQPRTIRPLTIVEHHYPERSVILDVWWVDAFSGQPQGREGQPLQWVAAGRLHEFEFPAANRSIVDAVRAALIAV